MSKNITSIKTEEQYENKKSLRVKRVDYTRKNNVVIPHEKVILEKLEDDCYRKLVYRWNLYASEWYIGRASSFYDGEKLNEIGQLCITSNNIERFFDLLVKYNEFKYMKPEEINNDNTEDLARAKEINDNNQ